jgi:AraC family transcriptional regulator, arabinose operon regulatory protein
MERVFKGTIDRRVAETLNAIRHGGRRRVADLARNVGLSASRLEHLIKEQTGIPLRTHLAEWRLQQAATLLEETHLRVSEICYTAGFCHPANFANQFRRAFGAAPSRYRRMRQQIEPSISRSD